MISALYPPHHMGGYELTCRDIVERWREAGHEVTVLTGDARVVRLTDDDVTNDTGVLRRLRLYQPPPGIAPPRRRSALAGDLANHGILSRALRDVRPDVVSVWHMGGVGLSLLRQLSLRRVRTVFVVCDPWMVYAPKADPLVRMFGRAVLPNLGELGAAAFCSRSLLDEVRRATRWTFPGAEVAWLGVDLRTFPLQSGGERPWRWRLLYVGRLDPVKGVATAVRALALLPAIATLDIVGRGAEEFQHELSDVVEQLELTDRVRFGEATREQLNARYRDADVVLFPSEWAEPFGIVPLEAMACGTPVVATGTGGSGEYLDDERNCLLFPPRDVAALANAVRRLADDTALRSVLVDQGRTSAASITVDELALALEALHVDAGRW